MPEQPEYQKPDSKCSKYLNVIYIACAILLGTALLSVMALLTFLTITRFNPPPKSNCSMNNPSPLDTIPVGKLELYTWNIGYCGLGKEMDFFYEGGKMVRPEKKLYERYRDGIIYQLTTLNRLDFILLQEVDEDSKRSYGDNQLERFKATFKEDEAAFAVNYQTRFVPLPLFNPMGNVKSGLLSLSRYHAVESVRIDLPGSYAWPKKLMMPDRCALLSRYPVSNGKQLVVINLHNSAYTDAADMRRQELVMLRQIIMEEYTKGNYVITGGDWNLNPPLFDAASVKNGDKVSLIENPIKPDWLPEGFTWATDRSRTTNRSVDKPYLKGQNSTTLIDFFVLSPNIKLLTVNTLDTGFEFSDHRPVGMIVELN